MSLVGLWVFHYYVDDLSQPQSSTGDLGILGDITGIERQSGKDMCQGGI